MIRIHRRAVAMLQRANQSTMSQATRQNIVIIGGGAAGMCAALEANGSNPNSDIIILESMPKVGGNSAKASSGMNGCYTDIQTRLEVSDSLEGFKEDTLCMADGMADPELVGKLVEESASAISFVTKLSLPLPLHDVIQLGGHQAPRTHRLKGVPIGAALMKSLAAEASERKNIRVVTDATVSQLLCEGVEEKGSSAGARSKRVTGVVYTHGECDEKVSLPAGAVVLATGGAACDTGEDGLMQRYAPNLVGAATSSGRQATGAGIRLAEELGAELINMHRVQIHPTGFIDPAHSSDQSKFLAPEALRGSGGVLLSRGGHRFSNELGSRAYLTGCIEKNCSPYETDISTGKQQAEAVLVLNSQAVETFGAAAMDFYVHKGLFREFSSLETACKALGLPLSNVRNTLKEYSAAAQGLVADPFGKVTFPTSFTQLAEEKEKDEGCSEKVYAAMVTPVIHYSLGGIKIDTKARVLLSPEEGRQGNQPVMGLFAAGECTGGVHGFDRLGGNSLLECVVFGRTAGKEAAGFTSE